MDAIPFNEVKPDEIQSLMKAYESDLDRSSKSKPHEANFHVTACRLVRLPEEEVTPAGAIASWVVVLTGYLYGTRHAYRLYLVEPHEVELFREVLTGVPDGAVLTPMVHVIVQPQAAMTSEDAGRSPVDILLGRLPEVGSLVRTLGLLNIQKGR